VRATVVLAIGLSLVLGAGVAVRGVAASHRLPPRLLLSHSHCAGHERWKIKVLADDEAGQLNKTAKTVTVDQLRANETRPEKVSAQVGRIRPVEFRRFRVHASFEAAFREGDGDLHVVIHDPLHDGEPEELHSMIIEFPNPSCEPQNSSAYVTLMTKARDNFVNLVKRCIGYTGTFGAPVRFAGHATVTGAGFWDLKHGNPQRGRAPNDLELHPVLKLSQATCR
jgi:hypothetical protein